MPDVPIQYFYFLSPELWDEILSYLQDEDHLQTQSAMEPLTLIKPFRPLALKYSFGNLRSWYSGTLPDRTKGDCIWNDRYHRDLDAFIAHAKDFVRLQANGQYNSFVRVLELGYDRAVPKACVSMTAKSKHSARVKRILKIYVDLIPKFRSLQSVRLHKVDIYIGFLGALQSELPVLKELKLEQLVISLRKNTSASLYNLRLTLKSIVLDDTWCTGTELPLFFDINSLEILDFKYTVEEQFVKLLDGIGTCPRLKSLRVRGLNTSNKLQSFTSLLSRNQTLERLLIPEQDKTIRVSRELLSPDALPNLKCYHGSPQFLDLVARGRPLTSLLVPVKEICDILGRSINFIEHTVFPLLLDKVNMANLTTLALSKIPLYVAKLVLSHAGRDGLMPNLKDIRLYAKPVAWSEPEAYDHLLPPELEYDVCYSIPFSPLTAFSL